MADVTGRMRSDWDQRARQDALYFAAFGRREQEEDRSASHVAPPGIIGMRTVATVPAPGALSKLTPYSSPK